MMISQKENNRHELLIVLEITLITLLILSDWTILFKDVRPEILFKNDNAWIKILTYIPLIWILQLHALEINKYFRLSLLYYLLLFFALLYRILAECVFTSHIFECDSAEVKKLISRIIFEIIIVTIIFLIYKNKRTMSVTIKTPS